MKEIPMDKIAVYGASIAIVIGSAPLIHRIPRSRGRNKFLHLIFLALSIASLFLLPEWIQDEVFSQGGVIVVGTILPVYESIVAVCSPGEKDDIEWLQFWVASGIFSFATEFMDDITAHLPQAGEHWFEFEFFFMLWLVLPFTDGAGLLYELITKPYIAPLAVKVKKQCESWIGLFLTAVNTSYIWFIWYAFTTLPEEERRFLTVALGTIYPIAASTVAITTESKTKDEPTYWLTYWSCFSLQFLAMDYIENFVGQIRGFYTLCAASTVYLFLPAFGGAEAVFRNVLVPLSGQHENMLLHDAYKVKLEVERKIPPSKLDAVRVKAAELFLKKLD